jgi:hypothetical protein
MKKIFLLIGLLTVSLFAEAEPVIGQKSVQVSPVTWSATSGNWLLKTRILFLGNNVYVDTSSTGQAGQFKRVDNTADSCSNPFLLTSDTLGSLRPIWQTPLVWELVRSKDKDSSTHVYIIQTRERFFNNTTRSLFWTPWTFAGNSSGYADFTVSDSILIPNVRADSISKWSQYGMGSVFGIQARLCPDDVAATANTATDSIFADSLKAYTR